MMRHKLFFFSLFLFSVVEMGEEAEESLSLKVFPAEEEERESLPPFPTCLEQKLDMPCRKIQKGFC